MQQKELIEKCQKLLEAYKSGLLGQTVMPEDSSPKFKNSGQEDCLAYFTLPMALNYQRNSYKLWEAALKTYEDKETKEVFEVKVASKLSSEALKKKLIKHKLALQPNKHITTWHKISETIVQNWGSLEGLLNASGHDFLKLRQLVQNDYKKGFPYLSGEKIFNYWCFILNSYCDAGLKNSEQIEIAPDTHITKCSVLLGVITEKEETTLAKKEIADRWRVLLKDSGINPIEMHPPLWFWSRNGFIYKP